jgi:hypothetical protein
LCGKESCKWCFDKSFAATSRGKYWSTKNKLKAWQVSRCSEKKFLLDCPDCDTCFLATISGVTNGTFCPKCRHKSGKNLTEHLEEVCDDDVILEATLAGCKDKKLLRFDYLIKKYKLIIELDGAQHFKEVPFFKMDLKENQKRDLYKTNFAISKGYTVLRLLQTDVRNNKGNWKDRLKAHLRVHKKPRAILMDSKASNYDTLRKMLNDSETGYSEA